MRRPAAASDRDLRAPERHRSRSCRSSFGGHAGESGAFTLLRFPESDLSDVVYLEQLTSALYLDKREEVAQYEQVLERLQQDSPLRHESRDLLQAILQLL